MKAKVVENGRGIAIETSPWLVPIEKTYPSLKAAYLGLEPAQTPENTERMAQIGAIRSTWRREWDSNPRCPYGHAGFQDRCLQPLGHLSIQ